MKHYNYLIFVIIAIVACNSSNKKNDAPKRVGTYPNKYTESLNLNEYPLLALAYSSFRLGDYSTAIEYFDLAEEDYGTMEFILVNRGVAYRKTQEYTKALKDYNSLIQEFPDKLVGYVNRSLTYINLERYSDALEDLNYAINLEPEEPGIYLNRGIVYYELGNPGKACMDWQKAIDLGYTENFDNQAVDYQRKFCE